MGRSFFINFLVVNVCMHSNSEVNLYIFCTCIIFMICALLIRMLLSLIRNMFKKNSTNGKSTKNLYRLAVLVITFYFGRSSALFLTHILAIHYSHIQILPFRIIFSLGILSQCIAFILLHIFYIYRLQTSFTDSIWKYSNRTYMFFYVYSLSFIIPTIGLCYGAFIEDHILTGIFGIYWTIFGMLILSFSVLYLFCKRLLELMVATCHQNAENIEHNDKQIARKQTAQKYKTLVNMNIIKCISQYVVLLVISNASSFITLIPQFLISNEIHRYFITQSLVSIDTLINSYCLYCTFTFAHHQYEKYCRFMDSGCVTCFLYGALCRMMSDKIDMQTVRKMVYKEGQKRRKSRKSSHDCPSKQSSDDSTVATTNDLQTNQMMEDADLQSIAMNTTTMITISSPDRTPQSLTEHVQRM